MGVGATFSKLHPRPTSRARRRSWRRRRRRRSGRRRPTWTFGLLVLLLNCFSSWRRRRRRCSGWWRLVAMWRTLVGIILLYEYTSWWQFSRVLYCCTIYFMAAYTLWGGAVDLGSSILGWRRVWLDMNRGGVSVRHARLYYKC